MAEFNCKLDQSGSPLEHIWSHTIGSDHARMALRADWQSQMRRSHEELGVRYVRFHGILDDDMADLLDEQGKLSYGFFNADQVIDFLLRIDMRPFVDLSFLPRALATGEKTVFHYRGNITPPNSYGGWADLIGQIVRHWVQRYGLAEVRQWYFEVWNEPNLDAFWTGGQNGYFELYRHTVTAIKAVDSKLRVGGPATANDEWITDFTDFCQREKLSYDFISTHHYPTDAFGKPGDDTETQLSLATRDILRQRTLQTCAAAAHTPVYYTEWCSSSNPFFHYHDEPYAAAFIVKNFMDVTDLVQAYSYWTFSDIFAENYFSSVPFHGGFGLLTINDIAKPTYRGMQLLSRLGHERLLVTGGHATVDASVVRGDHRLTVLLTNHAFPKQPISTERVQMTLHGTEPLTEAYVERIDGDHCNPRRLWESMGSPKYPNVEQQHQLQASSELRREFLPCNSVSGGTLIEVNLPAQAVAAITLEYSH
jgi:xylan 1,4-beta-xylosidase